LVIELAYSETIFIPETIRNNKSKYIITEVVEPLGAEDYVTYKIKGNFECPAVFDLMFHPYRHIEITN
jgi:hypothetical protein